MPVADTVGMVCRGATVAPGGRDERGSSQAAADGIGGRSMRVRSQRNQYIRFPGWCAKEGVTSINLLPRQFCHSVYSQLVPRPGC